MEFRHWDHMLPLRHNQNHEFRGQNEATAAARKHIPDCRLFGPGDILSEETRERSSGGPHSSNSSAELWRDDGELRLDDLSSSPQSRCSPGGSPVRSRGKTVQFLEMREKGLTQSAESALTRNMYQPYYGQLKIAVYKNCGLLTVHIIQARHLASPQGIPCSAYVRVSVAPDRHKRTKCKTKVVRDTDYPTFDEKFSFELLEGDAQKRLLISIWNRRPGGGGGGGAGTPEGRDGERRSGSGSSNDHGAVSDFLGCTSFGIKHLENKYKIIEGWYFLLAEDIGRNKHLKVNPSSRGTSDCSSPPEDVQPESSVNRAPHIYTSTPRHLHKPHKNLELRLDNLDSQCEMHHTGHESVSRTLCTDMLTRSMRSDGTLHSSHLNGPDSQLHNHDHRLVQFSAHQCHTTHEPNKKLSKLVVRRGADGGFGFSVTGPGPVTVCSIQPNGPAHDAGLREDDAIATLNGRDVQLTPADAVANAIRHSSDYIVLEIRRKARPWSVWRPPTLSEIPEYLSARCPSPTSLSCDLISGLCSFTNHKKKALHLQQS